MSTERTNTLKAVREVARAILLRLEDEHAFVANCPDDLLELRTELRATLIRDADAASRAAAERAAEVLADTLPPEEPPVLDLTDRATLCAIDLAARSAHDDCVLVDLWAQAYRDLARAADRLDAMEARRGTKS